MQLAPQAVAAVPSIREGLQTGWMRGWWIAWRAANVEISAQTTARLGARLSSTCILATAANKTRAGAREGAVLATSRASRPYCRSCGDNSVTALFPTDIGGFRCRWSAPVLSFGKNYAGLPEVPPGLRYCQDFINATEEKELLSVLDGKSAAWKRHVRRAQQFFGFVYYQTSHSVPELQPTSSSAPDVQQGRPLHELPSWFLPRVLSTRGFDGTAGINQVQGNEYLDDSGIGLHVEDPAAGNTLATVSLLAPIELTLTRAVNRKPLRKDLRDKDDCLKILLEPRSLLILQGPSRYDFAHAIRQSRLVHLRDGTVLRRNESYRRVSLTLREILEHERATERRDLPNGSEVKHT